MTWVTFWPFTFIPFLLVFTAGALPMIELAGHSHGGPLVREWFLNYTILPLMSDGMASSVVAWFDRATTLDELALHALVSLNVWALCFPMMYVIGEGIISFHAWHSKTSLRQKDKLLNKKW